MLVHASLFSGIGGFDLAADWMGWDNLFHCEWNPFGQRVLKHHFPNSISYNDITKTDFSIHRGQVDILTGGFPCQPYSTAGLRKGKDDERHLFPEMLRAIKEIRPRWVIGENVRGLVSWNEGLVFNEVCADLEGEGYEVQPIIIPAASVNAYHKRDRIWFIAYAKRAGLEYGNETADIFKPEKQTLKQRREFTDEFATNGSQLNAGKYPNIQAEQLLCGNINGISGTLDGITFSKWRKESIKAYGNAIVPQVAYQIFKAIEEFELMVNK